MYCNIRNVLPYPTDRSKLHHALYDLFFVYIFFVFLPHMIYCILQYSMYSNGSFLRYWEIVVISWYEVCLTLWIDTWTFVIVTIFYHCSEAIAYATMGFNYKFLSKFSSPPSPACFTATSNIPDPPLTVYCNDMKYYLDRDMALSIDWKILPG